MFGFGLGGGVFVWFCIVFFFSFKLPIFSSLVAHAFNPSSWEAKTDRISVSSRPAGPTQNKTTNIKNKIETGYE